MPELTALWTEAEEHLNAAAHYARRTVEEAWLAGDAFIRIRAQLPHGAWTPALKERGISVDIAKRMVRLRRKYPEIVQIARFASVSAALSGPAGPAAEPEQQPPPLYIIAADDFWDWEWSRISALGRKHLTISEQRVLKGAMDNAVWELHDKFGTGPVFSKAWALFRQALACCVDVGPLEGDKAALAETERRLSNFIRGENDG